MLDKVCTDEQCTGCMACVQICTHDAIHIVQDSEGFDRPVIDNDKCVECGLCVNTCPVNKPVQKNAAIDVYSGWSVDDNVRCSSSSGGAFSEIARPILARGGVVFGCAMNDDNEAVHIYVESWEDLASKLRGSKYVQSKIGNSFKQTKDFLVQGREVLFSGTPCQIAGLKKYLRREYQNLTTVDLICHGVPSPMVLRDYLLYQESENKDKITHIKFRSKQYSWNYYGMTLSFRNNSKNYYGAYYEDPYIRGFLRDYFLRPCCSSCQYTDVKRVSDFTVADWWGYKPLKEEVDIHKKGVSLILVNSEHGRNLFKNVNVYARERTIFEAKDTNICLDHPFPANPQRNIFWEDYRNLSFDQIINKYFKPQRTKWYVNFFQHHQHTDRSIKVIRLLMLPERILNKVITIFKQD